MSPEARDLLDAGREDLAEARQAMTIGLYRVAARGAYYAAFHAAEALILERTGQIAKTHSGVRSVFGRLVRDDPRVDRRVSGFLTEAYRYKEHADYGTRAQRRISAEEADSQIEGATLFLDKVAELLPAD